jgi:hypothetical protein
LHRRIDRYRHGTGIKNAEKGNEEVGTRRQHERDAVAWRDFSLD